MPDWSNGMISDSQSEEEGFDPLIGYYMVDMAKLADAVDCGSTVRNHVRVQVPLFTLITAVIRTDTEVGLSSRSHGFNSRTVDQI